jgi:hypothetical protein
VPITHAQVQEMILAMQTSILNAIQAQSVVQSEAIRSVSSSSSSTSSTEGYKCWTWGNRFHAVPEGFRFPKCTTGTLWHLWWTGNASNPLEKIAPYNSIQAFDLQHKADHTYLSKARWVISKVISHGEQNSVAISRMTISDRDKFFEHAYIHIFKILYPDRDIELLDKTRIGDVSYITLYDLMKKAEL